MPAQVGSGRFRSMGAGELLDAIFSLYRRNFLLIAAISALVEVPFAALQLLLFQLTGLPAFATNPFRALQGQTQTLTPAQVQNLQGTVGALLLAVVLLDLVSLLVVLPLANAATTRAVSDRYLDRETSVGTSYAAALRRLGPLIVQSLILLGAVLALFALTTLAVVGLALALGRAGAILDLVLVLAALVAAVILYVRTSLVAPAIVLEGLSGWRGLVRSWNLTRGVSWRLFGIRLLLGLITGIIGSVLTGLLALPGLALDPEGQFLLSSVSGAVSAVFLSPITYIGVTLLYYDTRIRKEGFDIEMLAQSL